MTVTQALEQKIIKAVCMAFGITERQLRSKSRKAHLCRARAIACLHLKRLGYSTTTIGEILSRDHSTVIWNLRKFREWHKYDPGFKDIADTCETVITGYNKKWPCFPCKVSAVSPVSM